MAQWAGAPAPRSTCRVMAGSVCGPGQFASVGGSPNAHRAIPVQAAFRTADLWDGAALVADTLRTLPSIPER